MGPGRKAGAAAPGWVEGAPSPPLPGPGLEPEFPGETEAGCQRARRGRGALLLRGGQVPRTGQGRAPWAFRAKFTPSRLLCSQDSLGLGNSPEAVKTAPVQQWKPDLVPSGGRKAGAVLLDPPERTLSSS